MIPGGHDPLSLEKLLMLNVSPGIIRAIKDPKESQDEVATRDQQ